MAQAARTSKKEALPPLIPRKGKRSLKAVPSLPETTTDAFDLKGDPTLTLEAMSGWSKGQRVCRSRKRHNWLPFTVWEHKTWLDVVERCSQCLNRRHAPFVFTERGLRKVDNWKPDYRDGYLLPKGAQRLDEDMQDELTAADILSRRRVEVLDDED